MLKIEPDIDLNLLKDRFTECGDYTKDVIFEELEFWRKNTDFLAIIVYGEDINGFILGYRIRNSLWLSQVWRKKGTDIKESHAAVELAKEWAIERGMTSMSAETKRNKMDAIAKYGFIENSINVRVEL